MARLSSCFSTVLLCVLLFAGTPAFGQETPRIHIEDAAPANIKNKPQLFNVVGTVTIPSNLRRNNDYFILIYTRSDEGGRIQLQTRGSEDTVEPRSKLLIFEDKDTIDWRIRIWLGTVEEFDPSYTIYAAVLRAFDEDEGRRLIRLTHNQFTKFKDALDILQQTGFHPLVWTDRIEVDRYE